MKKDKLNTNNRIEKAYKAKNELRCSHCPPNRGENRKSYKKYGTKKPKHKTSKRVGLIEHACPPNCPGCTCE